MPTKNPNKKTKTSFQKGNKVNVNKRNVKGREQVGLVERQFKQFDKLTLFRYLNDNIYATEDELKAKAKDKTLPMIQHIIITMLQRLKKSGDVYAFNALLDRIIGPITQDVKVELSTNRFAMMNDEELAREHQKLQGWLKERIRQMETGMGMYYVNPPKEVTPVATPSEPNTGSVAIASSGERIT